MAVSTSSASPGAFPIENVEIEALWRISQAINATLDLAELQRCILRETSLLLVAQSASVILYQEATNEAELTTTYGPEGTVRFLRYPLAASLTEWVKVHKQPLRISHLTPEEWPVVWSLGVQLGAAPERVSALLVPLWRQNVVIGSLEVVWEPHHVITDREERLLEVVAGQVALALTNAKAYQEKERVLQEHKRTATALRTSEARFRTIFEQAAIGIAFVDAEGHIIESNAALHALLGYNREELRRKIFTEFIFPDEAEGDVDRYVDLLTGERTPIKVRSAIFAKMVRRYGCA
jgi:PAS domain S-box-containing protein